MELNAVVIAIAVLAGVVTGFFLALKALQFGLRWNKQMERGALPTATNPPKPDKPKREFNPMLEIMTGEVSTDEPDRR